MQDNNARISWAQKKAGTTPPDCNVFTDNYCGKLDQLQTQNEKIINLTQKRLKRDFFPLFVKRLQSD